MIILIAVTSLLTVAHVASSHVAHVANSDVGLSQKGALPHREVPLIMLDVLVIHSVQCNSDHGVNYQFPEGQNTAIKCEPRGLFAKG